MDERRKEPSADSREGNESSLTLDPGSEQSPALEIHPDRDRSPAKEGIIRDLLGGFSEQTGAYFD